jgi:hypothetical protein
VAPAGVRQHLIEDLHLGGCAERTVEKYVTVVARLAHHVSLRARSAD